MFGFDLDPANGENKIDLALSKIMRRFIGRDAILIQTTELVFRLEYGDGIAKLRKLVRAGETCRAAANNGNLFARGWRAFERLLATCH